MMLTEQCQQARSTIEELVLAQRHQNQRSELRARTAQWNKVRTDWTKAVEQADWMALSPDSVPDCAKILSALRGDAREAAERLGTMQDISSLAADPMWTRLLQLTSRAAETLRAATQGAWRDWIEVEERPVAPAALRAKVANIPANRDILKRYEQAHADYERLARLSAPRNTGDASALRAAEAECKAALGGLALDAPPPVEAFFRAVEGHTATLANLTPEVLEWLRERNQLHQYIIRNAQA